MDQLVPFGSTVNGGGLVERGVNAGQCRHVHNGTVAGALPDVRKNIDRLEVLGLGHKVDRRTAKGGDQLVDQAAGRRKQGAQNTDNDHSGDEVGQIHHGLYAAFEEFTADFVDEQSQNDGNGKAHNNGIQADAKCVFDQTAKILGFKELDEIFEADPLAARDAQYGREITEGDLRAIHGRVHEHDIPDQGGQQHQKQIAAAPELFAGMIKAVRCWQCDRFCCGGSFHGGILLFSF